MIVTLVFQYFVTNDEVQLKEPILNILLLQLPWACCFFFNLKIVQRYLNFYSYKIVNGKRLLKGTGNRLNVMRKN